MISHGVVKTDFYQSVWCVVHAVNTCLQLQLMFPESQGDCEELVTEFIGQSQAGSNNCVGCIDGMLLWMENQANNNVQRLVFIVANFIVEGKANMD